MSAANPDRGKSTTITTNRTVLAQELINHITGIATQSTSEHPQYPPNVQRNWAYGGNGLRPDEIGLSLKMPT